jgi:hypothetical protein
MNPYREGWIKRDFNAQQSVSRTLSNALLNMSDFWLSRYGFGNFLRSSLAQQKEQPVTKGLLFS